MNSSIPISLFLEPMGCWVLWDPYGSFQQILIVNPGSLFVTCTKHLFTEAASVVMKWSRWWFSRSAMEASCSEGWVSVQPSTGAGPLPEHSCSRFTIHLLCSSMFTSLDTSSPQLTWKPRLEGNSPYSSFHPGSARTVMLLNWLMVFMYNEKEKRMNSLLQ